MNIEPARRAHHGEPHPAWRATALVAALMVSTVLLTTAALGQADDTVHTGCLRPNGM